MTPEDFDKVLTECCDNMKKVLGSKANEYARGDRLSNFKKAALALSSTPEEVCLNFWFKHVISIVDLVQDLRNNKIATEAMWNEKILDAVNYLVLLKALVVDRVGMTKGLRVLE
jgi:hypothetical protein